MKGRVKKAIAILLSVCMGLSGGIAWGDSKL